MNRLGRPDKKCHKCGEEMTHHDDGLSARVPRQPFSCKVEPMSVKELKMTTLQKLLVHLNGFGPMPNLAFENFDNAKLNNAYLSYANLSYATFNNANLRYADLENANLRNANLENANLVYASFSWRQIKT